MHKMQSWLAWIGWIALLGLSGCQAIEEEWKRDVSEKFQQDFCQAVDCATPAEPLEDQTPPSTWRAQVHQKVQAYVGFQQAHLDCYGLLINTKNAELSESQLEKVQTAYDHASYPCPNGSPTYPQPTNGSFQDQGDTLIWNSVALASYCLLQKEEPSLALQSHITSLWHSISSYLMTSGGRPIRHPIDNGSQGNSSISRDQMLGALYLGGMAAITGCQPVQAEYVAKWLEPFTQYGSANNWEYATGKSFPGTTNFNNWNLLQMVWNLYGQPVPVSLPKDSGDLNFEAKIVGYIYEKSFYCSLGVAASCLLFPDSQTTSMHLTYLSVVLAHWDAMKSPQSVYSLPQTQAMLKNLARAGANIAPPDQPESSVRLTNWLSLATYRRLGLSSPTFNDLFQTLVQDWPSSHLPDNHTAIVWRGCSDYQWQRAPHSSCSSGSTFTEFMGVDFLHAAAWGLCQEGLCAF